MLLEIFISKQILLLPNIGVGGLVLIALVVLLLFGGKKVPELMRGLGQGMKEFKDATKEDKTKEKEDK